MEAANPVWRAADGAGEQMGADPMAEVDLQSRVHGMEGQRVVDSSIMPAITTGNLNAPTIMIAEKAADAIRGREPLPPSDAPAWTAPDWETAQRSGAGPR